MKTILKLVAIAATLAPAMAFGQTATDVTPEQLQVFRDAITAVGCTIDSDASANIVEIQTGYAPDTLAAIVDQLRIYNEIVDASTDGGITYVSGGCST